MVQRNESRKSKPEFCTEIADMPTVENAVGPFWWCGMAKMATIWLLSPHCAIWFSGFEHLKMFCSWTVMRTSCAYSWVLKETHKNVLWSRDELFMIVARDWAILVYLHLLLVQFIRYTWLLWHLKQFHEDVFWISDNLSKTVAIYKANQLYLHRKGLRLMATNFPVMEKFQGDGCRGIFAATVGRKTFSKLLGHLMRLAHIHYYRLRVCILHYHFNIGSECM